ncbi:hypothetical protein AYI70_g10729 [Smittium culicis]|uniref:Uncharacterized protein n=1 Tax=Smittium culicis TaxID=133412 RepID=A0A1R1X583_9FUNG|nr:hypothetical protein AYI70_g10729 [Smittium culicis]
MYLVDPDQVRQPTLGTQSTRTLTTAESFFQRSTNESGNGKKPFRGRQQQAAPQAAPKTVTIAATAPVNNHTYHADGSIQQFENSTGGFRDWIGRGKGEGEPPVGGSLH